MENSSNENIQHQSLQREINENINNRVVDLYTEYKSIFKNEFEVDCYNRSELNLMDIEHNSLKKYDAVIHCAIQELMVRTTHYLPQFCL